MSHINRVLFIGSKEIGIRVLQEIFSILPESLAAVLTIDDTHDTRSKFKAFKAFSRQNKVELHIAENRTHAEKIIKKLKPELCFVVGWYWLISARTLKSVPFGFIGIHNSLLPKFRGGSPLVWSILTDEKKVGFSIFSFTSGMDDGAVWAQGRMVLKGNEYIADVLKKLEEKTIKLVRVKYPKILNGTIHPIEQNHEQATYCAQRHPHDGLIKWHKPAREIFNSIRAQSDPYPGAFSYYQKKKLTIWKARVFDPIYCGIPGQIARITDNDVFIICGDHRALILEEVAYCGQRGAACKLITSIHERLGDLHGDNR